MWSCEFESYFLVIFYFHTFYCNLYIFPIVLMNENTENTV